MDWIFGCLLASHFLASGHLLGTAFTGRHRIVGFEVKARSVDVSRYVANSDSSDDNTCKITGVTGGAGGLVLNSDGSESFTASSMVGAAPCVSTMPLTPTGYCRPQ